MAIDRINPVKRFDEVVFPALCAHRGLSGLMPESSIPGFAAGIALGADEIEFDIRLTKDRQLVVSHDNKVQRISDGSGNVSDLTLAELKKLRLRAPGGESDWEVTYTTPGEVFTVLGGFCVMNIHFKNLKEETAFAVGEMKKLTDRFSLQDSVYFSASEEETMRLFADMAPEIPRNAIEPWREDLDIVDFAVKYGCPRCQLHKGLFDAAKVKRAAGAGVACNVFWADDGETAREYLDMGVSVLLTNRTDRLTGVIAEYRRRL